MAEPKVIKTLTLDSEKRSPTPISHEMAEFSACLVPLSSICRPILSAEQVRGYYLALKDIPKNVLLLAAAKIAATRKYPTFPMPGEIREVAAEVVNGPGVSVGEAWDLSLAAVRRFGFGRSAVGLASLTPAVSVALRRFGWDRLCDTREDDVGTAFAQFRDIFKPVVAIEDSDRCLPASLRNSIASICENKDEPSAMNFREIGVKIKEFAKGAG